MLGDFEGDRYFLKYIVRLYLLMSMCRGVIYFVLYFCAWVFEVDGVSMLGVFSCFCGSIGVRCLLGYFINYF